MKIIHYDPEMAGAISAFYNTQMAGVPFTAKVDPGGMSTVLSAPWEKNAHHGMAESGLLVVGDGGTIRGFAGVGVRTPGENGDPGKGAIGFLLYERGNRTSGQMIVDAAHEYIFERTDGPIGAFHQDHRFPAYHFPHAYCSDGLDHVQALLQLNGYRKNGGEVYLLWEDYDPRPPRECEIEVEIRVAWKAETDGPAGLTIQAIREGKVIGECEHQCPLEQSGQPSSTLPAFCTWLGVTDEHQGHGLGHHLLRRALVELHVRGFRDTAISTAWDNYRAFVFYSNFGYRVVDWTYGFERSASPG